MKNTTAKMIKFFREYNRVAEVTYKENCRFNAAKELLGVIRDPQTKKGLMFVIKREIPY